MDIRERISKAITSVLHAEETAVFFTQAVIEALERELSLPDVGPKTQQIVASTVSTVLKSKTEARSRRKQGRAGLARILQDIESGVVARASRQSQRTESCLFMKGLKVHDPWKKLSVFAQAIDTIFFRFATAPLPIHQEETLIHKITLMMTYAKEAVTSQNEEPAVDGNTLDALAVDIWRCLVSYYDKCKALNPSWRLYKPPKTFENFIPDIDTPGPQEIVITTTLSPQEYNDIVDEEVNKARATARDNLTNRFF